MFPTFIRVLTAGAALALAAVPVAAQQKASEIPVETFMKRAENQSMSLSPDGKLLAALTPLNGRDNLVVVDLAKRTRTTITSFSSADVSEFSWVNASACSSASPTGAMPSDARNTWAAIPSTRMAATSGTSAASCMAPCRRPCPARRR